MKTGMTRASFRNTWVLSTLLILGLAFMAFQNGQSEQETIANNTFQLNALRSELDNAARRSIALEELDKLTINEKTATRLDILRHLGLEQSGYDFQVNARQMKTVGDGNLYLRVVKLQMDLPYGEAMALVDRLHETRKIVISKIEMKRSGKPGDNVYMILEGTIYGLEKNDVQA
ncbi:MAG: hypothetical protein WAZ18_00270 [Alphaproteobacteria bacterium]